MGIRSYRPYTPSTREHSVSDFAEVTKSTPEKALVKFRHRKKSYRSQYFDLKGPRNIWVSILCFRAMIMNDNSLAGYLEQPDIPCLF